MRIFLTCLITLTCLAALSAPAHSDFTQADRERMIQILTRMEEMDKRFEQIDKRFEELREDMNARFEQVNNQFAQVNNQFAQVNNQFAQVNNQFETITNLMMAIIGAFVGIVVMAIGFAYWDRRTMLRPLEEEVVKMKKTVAEKVEIQLQEMTTRVAILEKQVTQTSEVEAGKLRRLQDVLAEMGSKGGEDARLAAIFRGLL